MKTILLSCCILFCVSAYAQPLTADEMLQMILCDDYQCFSEQVIPNGYEVALNKETSGYQTYVFNSQLVYENESNPQVARPYTVTFTIRSDDRSFALSHTVADKAQRELLLAGFKHHGFEYVRGTKTKSVYDNTATEYKSDTYPGWVLTVTNFEKKDNKQTFMEYEFELMRPTEQKEVKK